MAAAAAKPPPTGGGSETIKVLYEPLGGTAPTADIVFFHGLQARGGRAAPARGRGQIPVWGPAAAMATPHLHPALPLRPQFANYESAWEHTWETDDGVLWPKAWLSKDFPNVRAPACSPDGRCERRGECLACAAPLFIRRARGARSTPATPSAP
jgi:hypothetical protein